MFASLRRRAPNPYGRGGAYLGVAPGRGTLATSGSTRPCLGRRLNLTAPLDRPHRRRLTLREQESGRRRQAPRRGDRMAAFVFRLETADGAQADPPTLESGVPNWRS